MCDLYLYLFQVDGYILDKFIDNGTISTRNPQKTSHILSCPTLVCYQALSPTHIKAAINGLFTVCEQWSALKQRPMNGLRMDDEEKNIFPTRANHFDLHPITSEKLTIFMLQGH